MRLSSGFWQTFKETPNDAVISSHKLMIRSGLMHKAAGGLYNILPMGMRSLHKIEQIIREELDKNNCFEVSMTLVTPGELWKESGRWDLMDEMLKCQDKSGRDICLSPTNEEAVTDIFRKSIKSFKQLPVTLYQINKKFRDEIRPRYGLLRSREFVMKDAYSFHSSTECMHSTYDKLYTVYESIIKRIGLKYIVVEADAGAMGNSDSKTHEFQVLASAGEDKVMKCTSCDYAANIEKAYSKRPDSELSTLLEDSKLIEVDTPGKQTIDEVAEFLNIEKDSLLKSLLYVEERDDEDRYFLVVLLGDDELNETALKSFTGKVNLRAARDGEFEKLGLIKGYVGPQGQAKTLTLIYDSSVDFNFSYVVGANQIDKHCKGFIPSRDSSNYLEAGLRLSRDGDLCNSCNGGSVETIKGIEVGHIFELGNKYTKSMNVSILDSNGKSFFPLMGCYGLGVTRVLAAAIEQCHDDNGIVWPLSIAPYQIYFATILKDKELENLANDIYDDFVNEGFEIILDDRKAGAGFKFKDADLLGLPVRIVLGEREYNKSQCFEVKVRKTGEVFKVGKSELLPTVREILNNLHEEEKNAK